MTETVKTVGIFRIHDGKSHISENGEIKYVHCVLIADQSYGFLKNDVTLFKHRTHDFQSEDDVKAAIRRESPESIRFIRLYELKWDSSELSEETQGKLLNDGLHAVEDILDCDPMKLKKFNDDNRTALANALKNSGAIGIHLSKNWEAFVAKYNTVDKKKELKTEYARD